MEFCKTFTPILQFNEDLPLNPGVVSDHAEIIAKTPYGDIACWNISNPLHHHYFGMMDTYTFSKTHMYLDKEWIDHKTDLQISSIVDDLMSQKVVAYIIVEGYLHLYRKLENILPKEEFGIFYDKDIPTLNPDDDKNLVNNTGIVVNLKVFNIKEFKLYSEIYEEGADVIKPGEIRKQRLFNIPVLFMEVGNDMIALGGVHIHGSNSRNPKTGLSLLTGILYSIKNEGIKEIIFMGDFNTIPKNVGDALKLGGMSSPFRITLTDYPTMVNPRSEVSFYDMVITYPDKLVTMESVEHTNLFTQELLESVCRSRTMYLMLSH